MQPIQVLARGRGAKQRPAERVDLVILDKRHERDRTPVRDDRDINRKSAVQAPVAALRCFLRGQKVMSTRPRPLACHDTPNLQRMGDVGTDDVNGKRRAIAATSYTLEP
jgi:hypothetical protein